MRSAGACAEQAQRDCRVGIVERAAGRVTAGVRAPAGAGAAEKQTDQRALARLIGFETIEDIVDAIEHFVGD